MSKSQKTFLKEENLLTLLSQNNFIIPEIQREYVWGNNEKVITKFLNELKTKIGLGCNQCNLPDSNERINIGFLYSYKPDYVKVQNDRFLDENLIDGQQRFTTLFLLVFYFALKENKKNDFLSLIRFEEISMGFDFKVRDITKRFLLEFVKKTNTIEDLMSIEKQTWFLEDYKTDISISAMIKSLNYIQTVYNCKTKYYNHFLSNIVFWHFKTEATSEGEELYITMNARGEDLAENEITKAAMMLNGKELLTSGEKWEAWQHFFWKNRNKNINIQSADFGFNAFINCCAGLENYIRLEGAEFKIHETEDLLTTDLINEHINAFMFLVDKSTTFKTKYYYADWVDKCLAEIWKIFNDNDTDWFADYTDQNKSTEQNKMIFIWSWLLYIKEKQIEKLDINETFRVLRFFYLRYKNNNRGVSSLKETIVQMVINDVFTTVDEEVTTDLEDDSKKNNSYRTKNEALKYRYLSKVKNDNQDHFERIESLIWELEDHPLNLIGADLKNINSSHLIDFEKNPDLQNIQLIKNKFFDLFPLKNNDTEINYKNINILRNVLFFYGKYWEKNWASYYWKFNFGNWKRIIRDLNSEHPIFKSFFSDYLNSELDHIKKEKIEAFSINFDSENEEDAFKWYASKLGEMMWRQGQYIALNHYNYQKPDTCFPNFKEFVNYKGTFNGGNPQVLSNLIENN